MRTHVVLAPGAEDNALATWAHATLGARLVAGPSASESRRAGEASALRASVGLVARDLRLAATLRFDRGTIVIHDGSIGTPDVTFVAALDVLRRITSIPLAPVLRLPLSRRWLALAATLRTSEITVYGLLSHPRLVLRLLRLFAPG